MNRFAVGSFPPSLALSFRAVLVRSVLGLLVVGGLLIVRILADETPAEQPPDDVRPLLAEGRVTFEFYDGVSAPRRFPGETHYAFDYAHRFRFEYQTITAGKKTVGAKVRLTDIAVEVTKSHVIHLPRRLATPARWHDRLTRHELDHVAVSSHPRLEMLLQELYRGTSSFQIELPPEQKLTKAWIEQETSRRLNERGQAVLDLIASNYRLLDQITAHGIKPIPERDAYFARLYTKENLDELAFPWTGDVLTLLKSEAYQIAKCTHLP